jgi:hypothetical protein
VKVVVPIPVQLVPSGDLAIVFPVDVLTAIHKDPFQKADTAEVGLAKGDVRGLQVIKLDEVLIWPEDPNATHNPFPNAMCIAVVNGTVTIQLIPSVE